jgi:TolB-like protein
MRKPKSASINHVIVLAVFIMLIMKVPLWAAPVNLSVLYFENLSGDSAYRSLGKAFAEIMIADLAQIKGLNLIERENVEKVFKEQALGQTGAIDSATSPQVGKLLGAQYMVIGNFVVVRNQITVNYKIVNTESGAILNAGSAAGSARKSLQVTGSLSAEVVKGLVKAFPDLKAPAQKQNAPDLDIKAVANYGNALDMQDKGDYAGAKQVLASLVIAAPSFLYGAAALASLEQRMQQYDRERQKKMEAQAKSPVTWQSFNQTAISYTTSMKYSALIAYCESVQANPPPAPDGAMSTAPELIDYYITLGSYMLKRWERVATVGESFLKEFPTSMYYGPVKNYVTQAATEMATIRERKAQADQEARAYMDQLSTAPAGQKNLLYYQIGSLYYGKQLYAAALEYYRKFDFSQASNEMIPADLVLFNVFMCYYSLADKKEATRVADALRRQNPNSSYLSSVQSMLGIFPE